MHDKIFKHLQEKPEPLMRMREQVEKRRRKLLLLLLLSSNVSSAIVAVSKEFGCNPEVLQRDYRNMDRWIDKIQQTKEKTHLLNAKLEFLARQSTEVILDCKNTKDKMEAIKSTAKITELEIGLLEKRGFLKTKGHEVNQTADLPLLFESNPEIMAAYRKSASNQKTEKEAEQKVWDEKEVADDKYRSET